jgi:hypothetical protein
MSTADLTALDSQWKCVLHYNCIRIYTYQAVNSLGSVNWQSSCLKLSPFLVHIDILRLCLFSFQINQRLWTFLQICNKEKKTSLKQKIQFKSAQFLFTPFITMACQELFVNMHQIEISSKLIILFVLYK